MAATEFGLIERIAAAFTRPDPARVPLGIGDDAALLRLTPGHELVISTDTLNVGVHFFAEVPPADLGHKALAVNLSDLAAMGAEPLGFTLALSLPAIDADWCAALFAGMAATAAAHGIALVGGDTTRGPLSLTVTVLGEVPAGQALRRDRALPGDLIAVSGRLGDAAGALRALLAGEAADPALRQALQRPEPRRALGRALRGLAHAAVDVSDGLLADLGHIARASGVVARVDSTRLPVSTALKAARPSDWADCVLGGGDDYELCVTLLPAAWPEAQARAEALGVPLTRIGECRAPAAGESPGVWLDGAPAPSRRGWDHFGAGA